MLKTTVGGAGGLAGSAGNVADAADKLLGSRPKSLDNNRRPVTRGERSVLSVVIGNQGRRGGNQKESTDMCKMNSAVLTIGAVGLFLLSAGCNHCEKCQCFDTGNQRTTKLMDKSMGEPQDHWVNMADNAMTHDMAVADFHFVPHTAEISGTGVARLDRMALLLDTYGGTVRYETYEPDEALVKKRLEHVKEYLTTTGCEMKGVEVKAMLSGGRTISATSAIAIAAKGTATSTPGGAAPAPSGPPARSGQ
jgi:hypothetical protein